MSERMPQGSCETCLYYLEGRGNLAGEGLGWCRRYPPGRTMAGFPTTDGCWFCGEYEPTALSPAAEAKILAWCKCEGHMPVKAPESPAEPVQAAESTRPSGVLTIREKAEEYLKRLTKSWLILQLLMRASPATLEQWAIGQDEESDV